MDPLLEANATFALKVLRVLGEDSSKNVFFSPLSMFSSLSMILLGANGTTGSQISKNEKKIVQMMFNKSNFRTYYVEDISTTLILLPYLGNQLSITIMLPDEYVELRTVENQITYEKLIEWTRLENVQEEEVEIFLPRFKLEESYDMKDVLCKLGMTDAFEEGRADFSGISSKPGLFLSKVVHKSVVEVNEEGTEAAAPTEIVTMGSPLSPQCLVADHPFLFLIQDDRSKAILFLGRFSSPC